MLHKSQASVALQCPESARFLRDCHTEGWREDEVGTGDMKEKLTQQQSRAWGSAILGWNPKLPSLSISALAQFTS